MQKVNFGFKVACILFSAVCFYLWLFRSSFLSPPFYAIEYHALDRKIPRMCFFEIGIQNIWEWMNEVQMTMDLLKIFYLNFFWTLVNFLQFKQKLKFNVFFVMNEHEVTIEPRTVDEFLGRQEWYGVEENLNSTFKWLGNESSNEKYMFFYFC